MSGMQIFGVVVVVLLLLTVMLYNRLVALRQTRNNAFSDIYVQLKQRYTLVPQLVETVKGYAAHEKGVLETVTAARAQVGSAGAGVSADRMQAESMLGASLGRLLAVSENYPALKADANFRQLMDELNDIENKIAAARRFFNSATSEYNTAAQQFPASLIANTFGFKQEPFFEVAPDEKAAIDKAPEVKFG